jgi:hypothetical protein
VLLLLLLPQMIGHYKRKWGTGLPLRHTLTIGLGIASALWHMHPSVVHRWVIVLLLVVVVVLLLLAVCGCQQPAPAVL